MPRVAFWAIVILSSYAAGTVMGPPVVNAFREVSTGLSPFLLLSLAVLVASIGYALGNLLGVVSLPRRRRRKELPGEDL